MDPFIILQDTAGITEAGFAGERDDGKLVRMFRAGVFGIAQAVRVTTGEHFVDGTDSVIGNGINMFGIDRVPVILKDLADGNRPG